MIPTDISVPDSATESTEIETNQPVSTPTAAYMTGMKTFRLTTKGYHGDSTP